MSLPAELFTQMRRVTWGDTDAAGTLYFANISRYCMEAIEGWFLDRLGIDWFRLNAERRIGTPCVRAELDFRSPATPRDSLAVKVAVHQIGRSSVVFRVVANVDGTGRCCWEGRFKCVFIDATTLRSMAIPDEYRPAFERDATLAKAGLLP